MSIANTFSAHTVTEDLGDIIVDHLRANKPQLRLAIVTETYPPEINGVALTIARFVDGLKLIGHDVEVIRPRQSKSDAANSQELLLRGLPIPRYPHLKMGLPAKNALIKRWSLHRPDVVHIVTEGPLGYSALQAALKLKLPVTSDFRTNFHAYSAHYGVGWLKRPIFAYLRKFHNQTYATMVPTDTLRAELQALGFQRLQVVARGVDTALFHPQWRNESLRASWGANAATPVAIYVGRIAPEKNLHTLIAAFKSMKAIDARIKLVLVGDGPARSEIEALLPEAIFTGLKRGKSLSAHYASGDIFLFPSLTETFGNVIPEAMASGLAVVAYDYAAAAQLIRHQASGLLATYNNKDAFVAAAAAVIRDFSQAHLWRVAARKAAETLNWDRLVGELEAVFTDAAAGARQPLITTIQSSKNRIFLPNHTS